MSTSTKRLNELLAEQQSLLNTIKAEAQAIDADELSVQNEQLKIEINEISKSEASLKSENEALKKSLSQTKSALFAKLANEKLLVFSYTQKKIESIYYHENHILESRLDSYEKNCRASIDATIKAIEGYGCEEFNDILNQLNDLKAEAEQRRAKIEAFRSEQIENATSTNFAIGKQLENEPLTEAEKRSALKQKSLESFIGLNVLGKAGIFLFIIGIIMLGRFAYVHMSDVFKGGAIYLLGAVLVIVGELFYKKEKTVFSTTLISGGVATLYAAAATCSFAFNLYDTRTTFIICVIITAIAIALSNQVKSEVVCAFGAVGGYLPVVALYMIGFGKAAADITFLPVSSVYFCLLAIVLFVMTYNKKWYVGQFIGYTLHLIAIGGIAKCAYTLRDLPGYSYALPLAVAFAVASFIIYLLMPGSKIVRQKAMLVADSILLALNTLSGAISVSITVHNCITNADKADRVVGYVFIVFALIYALLMVFSVKEKKEGSTVATAITSISALIFSMLITPLIFGIEYVGIAWSIEGAILALVSINKKLKLPEIAGLLCMALSVMVSFNYIFDSSLTLPIITISVILSAFWIYTVRGLISAKYENENAVLYIIIEIITAYASAGFIYYLYDCIINSPSISISSEFISCAVIIIAVLFVSIIIRLGLLKNGVTEIVSDIAGIVLFLMLFIGLDIKCYYNEIFSYYGALIEAKGLCIVNLIVLIALNIIVEMFFARAVLHIINRLSAPAWIYTMAISVSTLMLITSTIMNHFDVKFSSVIISAVYIAVACILLVIGFKKQYTIVRSGGLVLILCAFAKLCFVDTSHLDSSWKIASYFAFGAILIVISYFYQRFSKKLENDAVELINEDVEG